MKSTELTQLPIGRELTLLMTVTQQKGNFVPVHGIKVYMRVDL